MPDNPLGWLLMTTGVAFLIVAGSSEYAIYTLYTSPGALPFGHAAVWVLNWIYLLAVAPIPLFLALFPTGSPASPRWRWLPPAIVVVFAVGLVATVLRAGPVDVAEGVVDPVNPTGIESIAPAISVIQWVVGVAAIALSVLSVVSLVLRYRSARGEERQQIRSRTWGSRRSSCSSRQR